MAAIITTGGTYVDYSVFNGAIRHFEDKGKEWFNWDDGVAIEGWQEALRQFVVDNELNLRESPHAFVEAMMRGDELDLPLPLPEKTIEQHD